MLGAAGELEGWGGIGLAGGEPARHFLGVVKLIGDGGAIVARDRSGVPGVRFVDELEGCDVAGGEGLHFEFGGRW